MEGGAAGPTKILAVVWNAQPMTANMAIGIHALDCPAGQKDHVSPCRGDANVGECAVQAMGLSRGKSTICRGSLAAHQTDLDRAPEASNPYRGPGLS
jgi:hypothetical protein